MEHVDKEENHGAVINYQDDSEVHRLPVLHEFRADPNDTKIAEKNTQHRHRGVNKEPGVSPLI